MKERYNTSVVFKQRKHLLQCQQETLSSRSVVFFVWKPPLKWCIYKKIWDIIPKVAPKVYLQPWRRSHWPGSEEANCNLLMIFRSEWTKLKYTLNLVRCFLLHSTKFQYFFYGFKSQLSNSYDNWYVEKYLKGIFHKGLLLIWKECLMPAILSFSSPRCAIIAQLNKIWRVWACVRAIARHSRSGNTPVNLELVKLSSETVSESIDNISGNLSIKNSR